jgi:hypothetical protein
LCKLIKGFSRENNFIRITVATASALLNEDYVITRRLLKLRPRFRIAFRRRAANVSRDSREVRILSRFRRGGATRQRKEDGVKISFVR